MRIRHVLAAAVIGTSLVTGAMAVPAQATPDGRVGASANPAEYDCPRIHTTGQYAYTWCRVYKGKVRLIADCYGPDKYSGWITPKPGNPTQRLQAGPCILGPNSGVQGAS
ncbi:hypothetical protein [Embleya sp. NPDC059237]|uniref:hypothetical protein n=1 Tax=Embleya sp. NPDC059237 TaxID=3346784 RepID=UPI0036BE43B5